MIANRRVKEESLGLGTETSATVWRAGIVASDATAPSRGGAMVALLPNIGRLPKIVLAKVANCAIVYIYAHKKGDGVLS